MISRHTVVAFIKAHRLAVILAGVGVVVVALITAYILWSASSWSQIEARSSNYRNSIKNDMSSALSLPANTAEARESKRDTLKNIADKITNDGKGVCQVHGLLQWQQGMAYAKPKLEDYERVVSRLGEFEVSLHGALEYLDHEKQLSSIFASVSKTDKFTYKDFSAQLAAWQSAELALEKIAANASFDPVKSEAVNVAKAVVASWQAVIAANEAKDKKKYEEAVAGLAASLKGIERISALGTERFDPLARTLEEKYKAAL